MNKEIQPKYYRLTCTCMSCGATFETGSTQKEIRVEVCSNCHPFYTGQQKFVQAAGQVERFNKRLAKKNN